ncbi:hypothetical protein M405DRAFT_95040 [Rhizopogon salebrosus TDB-379]|nr:hypothetical protein M405DRAFT_95040 [Rhizopogon salebrosus TDB-379]
MEGLRASKVNADARQHFPVGIIIFLLSQKVPTVIIFANSYKGMLVEEIMLLVSQLTVSPSTSSRVVLSFWDQPDSAGVFELTVVGPDHSPV